MNWPSRLFGLALLSYHGRVDAGSDGGSVRTALLILFAGIAGVLVMASVNVANMMLARSIAREKELAMRSALGASRYQLARQLLTESVLLAVAGGLVGLVVMYWGVRLLVALAPLDLPRIAEVSIDLPVLGIAMLTTLLTGIFVGLLPSISSTSVSAQAALQDNSRGSVGSNRRRRARGALVVAEIALAVALTTGAGLLLRSFVQVLQVNPGFETTHLLTSLRVTGQDPIGQHVRTGSSPKGPWSTVIGVIGDVRHGGLEDTPQPELYISSIQNPPVSPFIVLRTTGDPAAMAETVRAEARLLDNDLPIIDMRTMKTKAILLKSLLRVRLRALRVSAVGLANDEHAGTQITRVPVQAW